MSPGFSVSVATVGLIAAVVLWYVFVRPVPSASATGTITGRSTQEARTLTLYRVSPRREDLGTTIERKLPAMYLFTVTLDRGLGEVRYSLERTAGDDFDIGQRVVVQYETRGVPFIWTRRYVREMRPDLSRQLGAAAK